MMAGIRIRLTLAVVLCFSCLIFMNGAVPITRISNLMHKSHIDEAAKSLALEDWKVENAERRMEMEVTDYPGSGANNRHTPRAQITKDERIMH